MKDRKRTRIFAILIIVFSVLCFYRLLQSATEYQSTRNSGNESIISIKNNESVSQKVSLCNTSYIDVEILGTYHEGEDDDQAIVELSVYAGGDILITKEVRLSQLADNEWTYVEAAGGNLQEYKGDAWVSIRLKNADDNCEIKCLLIDEKNIRNFPIYAECKINSIKNDGQYISMKMNYCNKIVCLISAGILGCIFGVLMISVYEFRIRLREIIKNNTIPIIGAALLLFTFIRLNPFAYDENPWTFFIYLIGYQYGLISKALPGAVMGLFTEYITHELFVKIILAVTAVVYFLQVYFMKTKGRGCIADDAEINSVLFVYMASPWFLTGFANVGMFGHPDVFVLLFYLLCLICLLNKKVQVFLPVFATAGVLTHQQFVFIIFPFLIIIMSYQYYKERDKKQLILYTATVLQAAAFSFYSQFIGGINIPLDQLVSEMQAKTDMSVTADPYYWEFFASIGEVVKSMALPNIYRIQYVFAAAIFASPFIIYVADILKYSRSKTSDKFEKLLEVLISISFLGVVILWALAADWGRYVFVYANAVFFFIVFCAKYNNALSIGDGVALANQKMRDRLGQHWLVMIMVYAVICGIGTWGAGSFYDDLNTYCRKIAFIIRNLMSFINL